MAVQHSPSVYVYSALSILAAVCVGCPSATGPEAAFTGAPTSGSAPLTVQFTDQSSGGSSTIVSWSWDFGDGATSSVANPSHTYTGPGQYAVSLTVTSSEGSDTESKPAYISIEIGRAQYLPGTQVGLVNETVGQYGAELLGPAGTPLEGVIVRIPPATIEDGTPVRVGYDTGTLVPIEGEAVGPIVTLDIGTNAMLEQPIEIVIPCPLTPGSSQVPVPYYIDAEDGLSLVELADVDEETGRVTLLTYHASSYGVVITDEELCDCLIANRWFEPGMDGFKIANEGSAVNRQGECLGMTMWALWYYLNHKQDGAFYPLYMFTVPPVGLTGQDIIATRAFTSVTQMRWLNIGRSLMLFFQSNRKNAAVIRNALVNSGKPVLLRVDRETKAGDEQGSHSVLAYAFRIHPEAQPRIEFDIYDPNYPGLAKTIKFNSDTGAWDYENYNWVNYYGNGSLRVKEAYEYILEDANNQFHSSSDAVITVTSHSNNEEVPDRVTTLHGTIESGEVAVTELEVWVNSESYKTSVPFDGQFYLDVPLQYGKNFLTFITRGQDEDGNKRVVGNNMLNQEFVLKGTFPLAVIRVELTWDKPGTDLDLYVYDPAGDVSWYADKLTDDGGELDYDDRYDCGPEHWTLTTTDTVQWGQDYRVRVHYFRDNDNGPTNYTMTIVLYEGELYETTQTYRGSISESDPENGDPARTGPDWRDIAVVTPAGGPKARWDNIRMPETDEPFYVRETPKAAAVK